MSVKIAVFIICFEEIVYFSLYNLHGCACKVNDSRYKQCKATSHFPTAQNLLKKNIEVKKNLAKTIEKILRKGEC